jgi:hypothetical protein
MTFFGFDQETIKIEVDKGENIDYNLGHNER